MFSFYIFSLFQDDDYYLLREDWRGLRYKFISLNEGFHAVGSTLQFLKDDMEDRFHKVILQTYFVCNASLSYTPR